MKQFPMASADWARLYRLSLYLLCEVHPSLVFSTLALHFPMRETLTHYKDLVARRRQQGLKVPTTTYPDVWPNCLFNARQDIE